MKLTIAGLLTFAAAPAMAHSDATLHAHGSDAAFWGLALISAAIVAGLAKGTAMRARVRR